MSHVRSVFTSVSIEGCKDSVFFSAEVCTCPSLSFGDVFLNTSFQPLFAKDLCGDALNKPADRKVYAVELTLRL
jgi:hypothetical protein